MGWFGSSPDLVTIANLQHPGLSFVWLVPDHVNSIQLGRKRVPVYLMPPRRCAVHVHGVCIHLSCFYFHASNHFSVITRTVTLLRAGGRESGKEGGAPRWHPGPGNAVFRVFETGMQPKRRRVAPKWMTRKLQFPGDHTTGV